MTSQQFDVAVDTATLWLDLPAVTGQETPRRQPSPWSDPLPQGRRPGAPGRLPMPAVTVDPAAFRLVPRGSVRVAARLAHGDTSLSRSLR